MKGMKGKKGEKGIMKIKCTKKERCKIEKV